jgi:hypothetical protein
MSVSRGLTVTALAVAFAAGAVAQGYTIKWVCDPKEHRLYRRDLGVVCWDGKAYRADDPGGIPRYMIDYFNEQRREIEQDVRDMRKGLPPPAPRTPQSGATSPNVVTVSSVSVPRVAPARRRPPVRADLFAEVQRGMARSEVLTKLGEPRSSISLPGDDGFVEIWNWLLTDGSTGKVTIHAGVVDSVEVQGARP